jgi:hypothetical protein
VFDDALVSGAARVSGNALVFGDAWVSGDARVSGTARVSGNARVSGDAQVLNAAEVSGNARVSGNAQVLGFAQVFGTARLTTGIIDGTARIESASDLCQIIHDNCVWSRFAQVDGTYRTTQTEVMTSPAWLEAALDAWQEARRD